MRTLVVTLSLITAVSALAFNGYYPSACLSKGHDSIVYDADVDSSSDWECETMIAIKNNREGKESELTFALTTDIDTVNITFRWHNTRFGDFTDSRIVTLTVDSPTGTCQPLEHDISQHIETGSADNIISLKSFAGILDIGIGATLPRMRASINTTIAPTDITVSCSNEAYIEYFYVASQPAPDKVLDTSLNPDEIDRMLDRNTSNKPCGMYEYYDRTFDPERCRPGGMYKLAVIPSLSVDGAFDIIYIDGAKTNARRWHQGMLKGRLTPTGLVNQYRLTWYDAMLQKVADDEMFAILSDDGQLLTLNYPMLQTVIRFVTTGRAGN